MIDSMEWNKRMPELLKGIKGIQCQAGCLSQMDISLKVKKGDDTSGGIEPWN
jgi:hypothetical protein